MSYILDALRKADAQRERNPARGIHAQSATASDAVAAAAGQSAIWYWALGGLVVVAIALVAWWVGVSDRPAAAVLVGTGGTPVVPVAPGHAVAPAAVVTPQAAPATQVLPPPPMPAAAPAAVVGPAKLPTKAAPASAPVAVPASAAANPERVFAVSELPADLQRELPKLAISGGVYSQNPAQRMLIVNGQVFNEGSELAPGAVLEQIRANTAVLKFRGYRYSVAY